MALILRQFSGDSIRLDPKLCVQCGFEVAQLAQKTVIMLARHITNVAARHAGRFVSDLFF
ncbi:hypothetical protein SNOG_20087 [Parastagonospora nodorum SN15]|uniref:Uncharacterized protein n=1 Tax=Phaeosphaeria nodorum (strain SN15 / ATCC MYA-4574 / FGSC 10173) TaxID=321614 RepID=A9JX84_PHANO|nr:hypothetical protein SNOG_20087 [Parastagonospora nodorum SN15]EDP89776.1 hypothetical protein SNOG_20087 [Parastagonospora nodorum SN15]